MLAVYELLCPLSLDKDVVGKAIGELDVEMSCRDAAFARYESLSLNSADEICAASSCQEQCVCDARDARESWRKLHEAPDTHVDDFTEALRQCALSELRLRLEDAERSSDEVLINTTLVEIAFTEQASVHSTSWTPIQTSVSPDAFYDAVYNACVRQSCAASAVPIAVPDEQVSSQINSESEQQIPGGYSPNYVPTYDYDGPTIEGGN